MTDSAGVSRGPRRRKLEKWLKLAGLGVLGICTVSIPLTAAMVLSATGSDLLTIGNVSSKQHHQTPAKTVAGLRCVAKQGYYSLTFDDGPFPATTPRLVATLAKANAVATFFDIGRRAAGRQDLVELERTVGQVSNQSYSQPHMPQVSQARRFQELQMAAKVLDYPNVFFRPPFGDTSPAVDADVRRTGLVPVYWTVDAEDARPSTDEVVARALSVAPGGIIRLHDGVEQTIGAIPQIVSGLRKRGMCPGFIAKTPNTVVGANGVVFNAIAVKP